MREGLMGLMQMAKLDAAVARLQAAGFPCLVVSPDLDGGCASVFR